MGLQNKIRFCEKVRMWNLLNKNGSYLTDISKQTDRCVSSVKKSLDELFVFKMMYNRSTASYKRKEFIKRRNYGLSDCEMKIIIKPEYLDIPYNQLT